MHVKPAINLSEYDKCVQDLIEMFECNDIKYEEFLPVLHLKRDIVAL